MIVEPNSGKWCIREFPEQIEITDENNAVVASIIPGYQVTANARLIARAKEAKELLEKALFSLRDAAQALDFHCAGAGYAYRTKAYEIETFLEKGE